MSEPFFDEPEESSSASSHEGLPKSTVILALLAVIFIGGSVFLLMKWTGAKKNVASMTTALETLSEQQATLKAELDILQAENNELTTRTGVLYNGKFEVCNESNRDIRIEKLAATFVNEKGEFETFNSEPYGTRIWTIAAGERRDISFLQGNVAWDGSVIYYAALLRGADGQQYPLGGTWPPSEAGCLRWSQTF